jgi:hypothetical protein
MKTMDLNAADGRGAITRADLTALRLHPHHFSHCTTTISIHGSLPPLPKYYPLHHHVVTRSRYWLHEEGAHPLPLLLGMVSRVAAFLASH